MSCQSKGSCQDLQKKLTPQQFKVTQEKGTEIVKLKHNCIVIYENHFQTKLIFEGFYWQFL